MDAQGLFGSGAAPDAASAPDGRRTKLFGYDSVAAQLLEPYGTSALGGMTLPDLWKATQQGNRKAAYIIATYAQMVPAMPGTSVPASV